MDDRTLTALKESIEHWRRLASGNRLPKENTDAECCALCAAFVDLSDDDECHGCPVFERTDEHFCETTPYSIANLAAYDFGLDTPEFKQAAKAELDFLISLLPENTDG